MTTRREQLEVRVRLVARALGRHGLVSAWGHCSARIDATSFLVCAPRPMGLLGKGESGTVVPIDGPLPQGVLGEVRAHQQIYARRADVNGVCRVMPPITVALSTQRIIPAPRHGVGAFVVNTAIWDDPRLLRDDKLAAELAETLRDCDAIVMRGNGALTVGASIERAMAQAYFLEDAARVEHAVRAIGAVDTVLDAKEIEARRVTSGNVIERLWEYMTFGDEETLPTREVFSS